MVRWRLSSSHRGAEAKAPPSCSASPPTLFSAISRFARISLYSARQTLLTTFYSPFSEHSPPRYPLLFSLFLSSIYIYNKYIMSASTRIPVIAQPFVSERAKKTLDLVFTALSLGFLLTPRVLRRAFLRADFYFQCYSSASIAYD